MCLCCCQERAPTSVAYAENQSMFLDSLAHDAAWLGRYARSREGEPIPWNVIEQMKTNEQTEAVLQVSKMTSTASLCLYTCADACLGTLTFPFSVQIQQRPLLKTAPLCFHAITS